MKLLVLLSALMVAATASAHMELGTFNGQTADGQACSMNVEKVYFENDLAHPLAERIVLTVNGDKYTVGHPPVISVAEILATFNHDYFHGILPTKVGAKALVITMEHTPTSEGPKSFDLINHEYKADKREVLHCTNLVHQN